MLAKKYEDEKHKVKFPCFIQPKIDGIRLIANKDSLLSRTGKPIYGLDHIADEVNNFSFIFDGELYSDKLSFQQITSICRKTVNLVETKEIFYFVYDIIDPAINFIDRYNLIKDINNPYIKVVPTYEVSSHEEILKYHQEFISNGYEGSMIRQNTPYKINGRSSGLLKYKNFIDDEFKIINVRNGIGKFEYVPIFTLTSDNGNFDAVPIGSQDDRYEMLNNKDNYIGKIATVKYFELTDDGIPRFPVLISIRDYE